MNIGRVVFCLFCCLLFGHILYAQGPKITNISKSSGTVNEVITISGNSFGSNANKLKVYFGAAMAEVVSASNLELKVKVPAGATSSSISVTNMDNNLTGYSSEIFTLSYDGISFNTGLLEPGPVLTTEGDKLYNLCGCDFNQDGLNDIVTTDIDERKVSLFQNTSPDVNNVQFSEIVLNLGVETRFVRCHDLNGDGLPDLVFSASNNNSNKDRIYVLQNISTVGGTVKFKDYNAVNPIPDYFYTINGNIASRIEMKDIDGDGKPEIVAVDFSTDGAISVFKNISTSGGAIKFNTTPITPFTSFSLNNTNLSSVDIEDLNGDGLPEILAARDEANGVFVFRNSSTSGSINFASYLELNAPGSTTNMKVADMDLDGKPDIVLNTDKHVALLRNTTSEDGTIAFASQVRFDQVTQEREGLDFADMDGNGKLDIIVGNNDYSNKISVLLNNSNPGSFDFNNKRDVTTAEQNISVRAADFNGDGKPDLAYTGVTNNKLYVLINRNCVKPVLEPIAGLGVCDALPFELTATLAVDVNYSWETSTDGTNFTPITGADASAYTASVEAFYKVKVTSNNNGYSCNNTSNIVEVVRPDGFVPDTPTIIDKDPSVPYCYGTTVNLKAASVNANYFWEGPNDYISSDQNPVIENITSAQAGEYRLFVKASEADGGCQSEIATTLIQVNEPEEAVIKSSDSPIFFDGGEANLSIQSVAGNTYKWKYNQSPVSGAASSELLAKKEGSYVVEVKNAFGCVRDSNPFLITIAKPTFPQQTCLNEPAAFSITPTSVEGLQLSYRWTFGDGTAKKAGSSLSHQYESAGNYTVTVEIMLNNTAVDQYSQDIKVIAVPELEIATSGSKNLCPGEEVELIASGTFKSFVWQENVSESNLVVTEPGTYKVVATSNQNCVISDSVEILRVPNPEAAISAPSNQIVLGESVQLTASGGETYQWTPGRTLSDSTIHNPVARPLLTTTYLLTVISSDGCQDTTQFTVNVERSLEVNAQKIFTPNNDGQNDTWVIDRIDLYEDCTISIFNRQGIKVHEVTPYDNSNGWDGTQNGTPLPTGAYYYMISCGGDAGSTNGSVTIVR